ncbi:stage II sporulation protein P [Cohnella terricola]|uniref:SH3 domain-containing protein n=1 Tax=Cohnella terricola TaxID=1289167 RepID=A0A559JAE7_9BACL|nr:stage II sporulation protein P [Cohnella terricola]TVX96854.1 SH3 domain-containing protein [Cohnella terricola]
MFLRKTTTCAIIVVLMLFVSFVPAYGANQSESADLEADTAIEQVERTDSFIEGTVVKIVDITNLRSGPGLEYEIVGKAAPGDSYQIIGVEGDWYNVSLLNGESVYVAGWVVTIETPERFVYIVDKTNLRSGPGLEYEIVGKASPGDSFPIIGAEADWHLISLPTGDRAYVANWVVKTDRDEQDSNLKVYIYHTHNRESWANVARNTKGSSVDDPVVNITMVGKHLGDQLQKKGILTLVGNDDFNEKLKLQNLSYSLSYSESRKAVTKAMKANPSLSYFFDIHRDANVPRKTTTVTIKGKAYARILFVIGTAHPNHAANKKLAEELNTRLNKKYPGLSRGVISKSVHQGNGEYNQSLSPGSLLLEVGGVNNTLEESKLAAEAFADVFSEYYGSLK